MEAVRRLYEPRAGAPLWLDAGRPSPAARAAIVQLLGAPELGLDPGDYDAALLDSVAGRIPELSPEERAHFDVLLTVGVVRFFGDVRHGRLRNHPLSTRSGPAVPLTGQKPHGIELQARNRPQVGAVAANCSAWRS